MGRARGLSGAVGLAGFDQSLGRRRGTGETNSQAEARDPMSTQPQPPKRPDVHDVVSRLDATFEAGKPLDEATLTDACALLSDPDQFLGMHIQGALGGLLDGLHRGAVADELRQPSGNVTEVVSAFGRPLLGTKDVIARTGPRFAKKVRMELNEGSVYQAVTPKDIRRFGADAIRYAHADALAGLLCDSDHGEDVWRKLPEYEQLRERFGRRRLLPDRDLSRAAEPDRLRHALHNWMNYTAQTDTAETVLAPAFEGN